MNDYRYSIWLVPHKWKEIQKEFNIDFIPHITLATNLPYLPYGILDKRPVIVKNFKKGQVFSKRNDADRLYSFGYPCDIDGIYPSHIPHLTLFYSPNPISDLDTYSWIKTQPTGHINCYMKIADTTSPNPINWKCF